MLNKVCIVTTVHQPFDTRIFHKEAKTLVEAGYNVTLIAQHKKEEIVDGIKIIPLPKPKNRLQRIILLGWKAYKLALEQGADVYHFHDPEFLPWAKKLKNKTDAKVIYDVHEDYPADILSKSWIPLIFRFILSKTFDKYEKKIANSFDFIIAAWPKIAENLKKNKITKIGIINNYPILKYFYLEKNQNKSNANMKEHLIRLIYVGGLTRIRGIKEIVQSLEYVNYDNIKLVLIGNFQEKTLEKELIFLPEWQKVECRGWLTQREAYKEMQSATVGLLCLLPVPNHMHSVPNKLFEYMAAGIPVIASALDFLKEIINKNNCGICVDPRKPQEIAKAAEYLIEHRDEAGEMGKNGKKAVQEKYNWENESIKLLEIYQQLNS